MAEGNTKHSCWNKNAQIVGQIFVFILAGIIFILIISYGYKAISYFIARQEEVVLVDFKNDIELAVEGVKRDYGTVRKLELKLPSKYSGACFFNPDTCAEGLDPFLKIPNQNQPIRVPWAQQACETKSENVFLVPRTGEKLYFPDLDVEGYLCVPNVNGIVLRLEGTGRKARVSEWKISETD